jgi:protocatechuate 3,4-dioxygenase alpha subunit
MLDQPLVQSPSQTAGPFFHVGLIRAGENILATDSTRGERITLTGRVLDGDGEPVPDALVEIWQADARGYFNHPADPHAADADRHFRGAGRAATTGSGEYVFETIRPGLVAGRDGGRQAPHVNVRVFARGLLIHADTRMYFPDSRENAADPLLESIDPLRRHTVIATPVAPGAYRFDIRLQGQNETVFFEL